MNARSLCIVAAFLAVSAAAAPGGGGHSPRQKATELPPGAGRDAYRQIVQDQCVKNWKEHHLPDPCERVFFANPNSSDLGYALLGDPAGGAHYLLIPTQTMKGTDSAELLDPDAPNYFAEAWHARDLLADFTGHDVPRTAVGLVVNTASTRTQSQFHIHIECLRRDVVESLRAAADHVSDTWSPLSVAGSVFQALRISDQDLNGSNLFELLANLSPNARHHLSDYTLIVAGVQLATGPGFVVLTGTGPTGEILLDSTCTAAGGVG